MVNASLRRWSYELGIFNKTFQDKSYEYTYLKDFRSKQGVKLI